MTPDPNIFLPSPFVKSGLSVFLGYSIGFNTLPRTISAGFWNSWSSYSLQFLYYLIGLVEEAANINCELFSDCVNLIRLDSCDLGTFLLAFDIDEWPIAV